MTGGWLLGLKPLKMMRRTKTIIIKIILEVNSPNAFYPSLASNLIAKVTSIIILSINHNRNKMSAPF